MKTPLEVGDRGDHGMRYSATAFAVLLLQRPPVRLAACHEIDWDSLWVSVVCMEAALGPSRLSAPRWCDAAWGGKLVSLKGDGNEKSANDDPRALPAGVF